MIDLHLIRDNGRFEPFISTAPVNVLVVHVGSDISSDPEDIQDLPAALAGHAEEGIVLPLPGNQPSGPGAPEVLLIVDNGTLPDIRVHGDVNVTLYDVGSDIYNAREWIQDLPALLRGYGARGHVQTPAVTRADGALFS